MSTVDLQNIKKSFGDVEVIKSFNATFEDGEFVTLLGPSGCGKTTLLRMVAGFEKPTSGQLCIGGKIMSSDQVFVPPEKRQIGMVFQSYAVWPHMNVFDNIAYPLKIQKMNKQVIKEKTDRVLKVVHLDKYRDRFPSQLSGGQQQRIALGRALVAEPELLLLDEPLSNLDAKLRDSMRYEIKKISKELGITVIFVTHDQTEAMTMSDKIIILNRGVIQQAGAPYEIYHRPVNQFVADFIGKINLIKAHYADEMITVDGTDIRLPHAACKHEHVVLAVRPENIILQKEETNIPAVVDDIYFLGETTDIFLRLGDQVVRCMAESHAYAEYAVGDRVYLRLKDYLVYDDGDTEEQLEIVT
ncbi:MAG: ABC transporter ATP-binding protein [Eubacteriales bacterium]|nr:ABC transporter ATP-binding protein [Eubacteriales bacterium]